MTVADLYVPDQFDGTGANTPLPTTFAFNNSSEIKVTSRITATGVETVLTETTHYTVTGGSWATGTVTPVNGATDFPTTVTWTLERVTPLTQATDWVEQDAFSADSHERAADKLTLIAQERDEKAVRSLKYPPTDSKSLSAELPNSVDRASKSLGFDAAGEPVALSGTVSGDVTVTTFMETVLDDADAATARATLDAQEHVLTTRGDILKMNATPKVARLQIGSGGTYLRANGLDPAWQNITSSDYLPRSYLAGLGLSNDTDADHDIAIAVGECRNSTNVVSLVLDAVMTKQIDAAWAVGDDAGGLFSGAVANNTDYAVFLIQKSSDLTIDAGFDTDPDAANIPTGYIQYRRIGWVVTDGSANILAFIQDGDYFRLKVPQQDTDADFTTSEATETLEHCPPNVRAFLNMHVESGNHRIYVYETDATEAAPSETASPGATGGGSSGGTHDSDNKQIMVKTDASSQIHLRGDTAGTRVRLNVLGWFDTRGRDE